MTPLDQVEMVAKAFIAYVEEIHAASGEKSPPVDGLCGNCGFPVYTSEFGGGRYHYSTTGRATCGYPVASIGVTTTGRKP
jgi:hypothetical protein